MKTKKCVLGAVSGLVFGWMMASAVWAADPLWEAVPITGSEADVVNEGRAVFGYTFYGTAGSSIAVNGVAFDKVNANVASWGPCIETSPVLSSGASVFYQADDVAAPYCRLLQNAFYGSASAMTVTLKNLDVGKTYQVQMFFTDERNPGRWAAIGDAKVFYGGTDFPKGGILRGTFTAEATSRTIDVSYSSGAQQLNAIALRRVSRHVNDVRWTLAKTTGADADVDVRGDLVFARAMSETTLNGTHFMAVTNVAGKADWGSSLSVMTSAGGNLTLNKTAFNSALLDGVSAAYRLLLEGGAYVDNAGAVRVTVKNLKPGRRYLVQLWVSDSRSNGDSRSMSADDAVTLRFRNGTTELPYGHNATGIFTAETSEQEITLKQVKGTCIQVNAVQVREIGSVAARPDAWQGVPLTGKIASDIRSDGESVFAYVCHQSAGNFTLNGTTYKQAKAGAGIGDDVTFAPQFDYQEKVFCPVTAGLDDGYADFLKNAAYGQYKDVDVSFGNLDWGFRYLAQMIFVDLRTSTSGRTAAVGGAVASYNGNPNADYPFGGSLVGGLTSCGAGKTVRVTYSSGNAQQLNSIQLRCVGFDGCERTETAGDEWSTSGVGWRKNGVSQDGVTLWDAENGPGNAAGFASDAALTLTSDVWADAISARGNLTVDGVGKTLTVSYGIFAPTATVGAVWGGRELVKSGPGRLVLGGGAPHLEEVLVTEGEAVLASDPEKTVKLTVLASGVLEVSEACAVKASALAGAGTLKGPGRIDLPSGGVVTIPSALKRDGIVWGLLNGTTLEYADGSDLSGETVYVDDPECAKQEGRIVLHVSGTPIGKPKFVFAVKGYRAAWDAEASGYKIVPPPGLVLLFR